MPGSNQRLHQAERSPRGRCRSFLAELLLDKLSWGLLSAVQVQAFAKAATLGGAEHEDLKTLSQLGTSGQWAGNTRRDLLRRVMPTVSLTILTSFDIPIQNKYGELDYAETSVLLPSDVCRDLFHKHRVHFDILTSGLAHFWKQIRPDDPTLFGHPMLQKPRWQERALPLVFHGDGVQFVKGPPFRFFTSPSCWILATPGIHISLHFWCDIFLMEISTVLLNTFAHFGSRNEVF